jgi:hypothetical protein
MMRVGGHATHAKRFGLLQPKKKIPPIHPPQTLFHISDGFFSTSGCKYLLMGEGEECERRGRRRRRRRSFRSSSVDVFKKKKKNAACRKVLRGQ